MDDNPSSLPGSSADLTLAVNARFATQHATGTQRYAREVVSLLPRDGLRVLLLVPPGEILELRAGEKIPVTVDDRWSGVRGHVWEQGALPRLFRRSAADILLSPCGVGPVQVSEQMVVVHDLHPVLHPDYFAPSYARWFRLMMRLLIRRKARLVAASLTARQQLVAQYAVEPSGIPVVLPGVGPPFTEVALEEYASQPRRHCIFVGGDKAQKNLAFLTRLWPALYEETGLELLVTERAAQCRVTVAAEAVSGVVRLPDPSDDRLAEAYAGALCLLWPSIAEGYGIPLLEAMAVGTPFISTDVGAASELAIEPDQVLPLDADLWMDKVRQWWRADPIELRTRGAERARRQTWDVAADALAAAVVRATRPGTPVPIRRAAQRDVRTT